MSGYLVKRNFELQDRVRKLEESLAIHRGFLRQIDRMVVADTRPERYVVPSPQFDALMFAAGIRRIQD